MARNHDIEHFALCSAMLFIPQNVYSVLYIKNVFSSLFLCIFCHLISACKAEQTFARNVQKNVNRCTHTHPFTLSVCCFYLVALQCHTEYGENIFLGANKSRQTALFSVKINAWEEPKDDTSLKVFRIAKGPRFAHSTAVERNNFLPKRLRRQYANLVLIYA